MKIKNVLSRAVNIIGLEHEVDVNVNSQKLNKLLDSLNLIYSELTLEYIHLKTKENKNVLDNRIYYDCFNYNVREILSVKKNGEKLVFTMYPLYVEIEGDGEVEVTYLYHLGALSIDDELILPPQFNEYIIATGVASEYCYRTGLIDEAVFYKNRYDNAVVNLSKRLKSFCLPVRRLL